MLISVQQSRSTLICMKKVVSVYLLPNKFRRTKKRISHLYAKRRRNKKNIQLQKARSGNVDVESYIIVTQLYTCIVKINTKINQKKLKPYNMLLR